MVGSPKGLGCLWVELQRTLRYFKCPGSHNRLCPKPGPSLNTPGRARASHMGLSVLLDGRFVDDSFVGNFFAAGTARTHECC